MLTRVGCWLSTDAEGSYQVHQGELYAYLLALARMWAVLTVVSGVEEVGGLCWELRVVRIPTWGTSMVSNNPDTADKHWDGLWGAYM